MGIQFGDLWQTAQPFVVGLVLFLVALLVRRVIYWILHEWAKDSRSDVGNLIVGVTRGASLLWCFLLGAYLAVRIAAAPSIEDVADKVLVGIGVLSAMMVIANIAGVIIRSYATKAKVAGAVSSLSQTVAKAIIIAIGSLLILDNLGVNIGSMMAALGIGSLAVALALQTTLSNIFSGAFIIMGGYIKPNDYIRLDSGDEGYVTDIRWGTTQIRTLSNSVIIVPNSRLAQAIVANRSLHAKNASVHIPVSVSYDSDPEVVERVLMEEAKGAVDQITGLLGEPAPVVHFIPGFGDRSLGFTLTCFIRDFDDQSTVEHELRKRIFKRFRAEGIRMPG